MTLKYKQIDYCEICDEETVIDVEEIETDEHRIDAPIITHYTCAECGNNWDA